MRILSLLVLALTLACAPEPVTRDRWQQWSSADRVLYVNTLLGAEKTKAAKGGTAKIYPPAEEVVRTIDTAYAKGDTRTPDELFASMGGVR
jgi:hypothetical protein